MDNFLSLLNEEQLKAVTHGDGPALVLAGAGSGKTRVVTFRIAYLHKVKKVPMWNILSVTFTNKAADEMKERVESLLNLPVKGLWIGTFHSICARILREFSDKTGFNKNFSIYDVPEQLSVVKSTMKELEIPEKTFTPKEALKKISFYKNNLIYPESIPVYDEKSNMLSRIYLLYQEKLFGYNAMDFDDLLVHMVELLENNKDVKQDLQKRFLHILVDEYQDTNHAQYKILKLLTNKNRNLFVVGDDDQSIYGFRGADLNNILNFDKDFPKTTVYRLQRNYRSTPIILRAASEVVSFNNSRRGKDLWTKITGGEKITLFDGYSEEEEAEKLMRYIKKELKKRTMGDILICYRTNAQSRPIEESLRRRGIPYRIVKGIRFYERKEIKDLIGYIKFIVNRNDLTTLERIINTPPRGIGKVTLKKILSLSINDGYTLWEAIKTEGEENRRVKEFVKLIEYLETIESLDLLVNEIAIKSGYLEKLEEEGTPESQSRIENIRELLESITYFLKRNPYAEKEDFLNEVALLTDRDTYERGNEVNLMTIHNTKGLEFPVVFITGMVDGVFPHIRSLSEGNIEEERRLFYVGLTRAKEKIYLSYFKSRNFGSWGMNRMVPSQFLRELPSDTIKYEGEKPPNLMFKEENYNRKNEYVDHPFFGRGKIIKIEDGDKLVISFRGTIKRIKKSFFKGKEV